VDLDRWLDNFKFPPPKTTPTGSRGPPTSTSTPPMRRDTHELRGGHLHALSSARENQPMTPEEQAELKEKKIQDASRKRPCPNPRCNAEKREHCVTPMGTRRPSVHDERRRTNVTGALRMFR
jgi:hypothetical protein